MKSFSRMMGGEIFIPKIPSMKVIDVARAIVPNCDIKEVGIRPGEKLHEVMCPKDDARLAIEFFDHYVLRPAINFNKEINYFCNQLNENGNSLHESFEYESEKNPRFLSIESLKEMHGSIILA